MRGERASATMKSAKRQNSQPVKKAERATSAAQPQNWMRPKLNTQQSPLQKRQPERQKKLAYFA